MPRATVLRLLLAGVLLHLALYARGLTGGFTFDDRKVVLEDPAVSGRAPLASVLSREFLSRRPDHGTYFRPLTLVSLGIDARLFGLSAGAMRLENILLAGLGAGLFAALVSVLGAPAGVVWATLLVLSCHPIRSEAVLSIVVRSDLLVFALVVGALLAAVRALSGGLAAGALSGVLFALALFAKENAFVAPALLLLVVAARSWRARPERRGAVLLACAWVLALAAGFGARRAVLGGFATGSSARLDPMDSALVGLPPSERLRAAVALLPLAGARLVVPATLAADYGSASFAVPDLLEPRAFVPGAVILLAAPLVAIHLLLRRSAAGLGLAWTLLSYLPFANLLFPTPVAFAERLLYIPAAGLALVAAAVLVRLPARAAAALVAGACVLGAARIETRIPEWHDDRALFTSVVRDVPQNGRIWLDLALYSLSEGDAARAGRELTEALRADPRLVPAARGLLGNAERLGNADAIAAIRGALLSADRPPHP